MTKHKKIFTVVSVDERLPESNGFYFVITKDEALSSDCFVISKVNGKYFGKEFESGTKKYTHWLEEQSNVIVFTPEELKELLDEYYHSYQHSEEFLQSKGIL